ncbi:NAD(P)/FAD-dependent oxidoreductase [Novosphingobium flavum]|uniref:Thioredoxin reductase n=1 Tax=Novosphingobium flavum TaxID=1778672 RepID=A0A7X1FSB3_9SPHN|nr:NAD(P)/FAD-dependent oxidoreductase [Novosphingobium flavum]MBC2666065.1 NAD(P)/FAD-dependent oxidoreductase [Novosphingobium flavum]
MIQHFDLAVIGQGYAGLCAAREARARGLSVAAFEGVMVGGAVMTVLALDPSPESFTTSGPDLGAIIGMENIDAGVVPLLEPVTALTPAPGSGWTLHCPQGVLTARQVIVATGTRPRLLGVPGVARLVGKGISHCADCDGPDLIGKDCVVVGGGDAAFQEAAILARIARSVTIVMRGAAPRARADLVGQALAFANVVLLSGRQVRAVMGDGRVSAVRLDGDGTDLACDGLFLFIGGEPETGLLPEALPRGENGGLVTGPHGALGLPGLWAIGSVRAGFAGGLAEAGEEALAAVAALCR